MEELRSALDQLKEELGTCRWKEREAEEKAANARLQKSILEQEVCAAKSDMALMEQAIEGREHIFCIYNIRSAILSLNMHSLGLMFSKSQTWKLPRLMFVYQWNTA